MGYRVIRYFTDLRDNNHEYHVGDSFPHDGLKVGKARIEELSTDKNRRGIPLIKEVVDEDSAPEANEPVEAEKPKKKRTKKNAE